MSITVGDKLPEATFTVMDGGPKQVSASDVFAGKRVALFAVPGAFTPTCSEHHLPGFIGHAAQLKAKGVDMVACTAVNDVFVLDAWANAHGVNGLITMLADGSATFAKALGLDVDLGPFGLGVRSKRYAMIVEDGAVKYLAVEDSPPEHSKATAEKLLAAL
ncbi:alkyl hydroperoxide reductase [Hyphomicrobium nitrativorans NL23]|uniref:Glutathione-dependent peroxiredoxin n=1 Tax=Hyphomicrobium nitrativorans NL23 TaxID=1029756 RepID=V5SBR6_9HYPH|nr:peroxiredoxin [Hyphomicrobium nitrativorans]AHB47973.1 alkyl hydroperoxide reductase [Hyphomicrobium nitrativorans NL23]